jgi:hypothetical protein
VKRQDGTVAVDEAPGGGARFVVRFRALRAETPRVPGR